jgi:nucleoside-diphosphate-sugar epimerase
MIINGDGKIVVTGAGGWLGTEYLEVLLEALGGKAVKEQVICLGSKKRTKVLSDGTELQIFALTEVDFSGRLAGLVHLAFLTRDKASRMSLESYSYANLQITSAAVRLIETNKPKWVATVSSGAVFSSPGGPLENDLQANPYGFTKRVEETLLTSACEGVRANLAIGRLWGAMGRHMPINRAYAVSDFIAQAMEAKGIKVHADHEVFRRYCLASDFMKVLVDSAKSSPFVTFDSGGEITELGGLAKMIADSIGVPMLERPLRRGSTPDRYYPTSDYYEKFASTQGILLANLSTQVSSTLLSHGAVIG